jgi:hypothetical protein
MYRQQLAPDNAYLRAMARTLVRRPQDFAGDARHYSLATSCRWDADCLEADAGRLERGRA